MNSYAQAMRLRVEMSNVLEIANKKRLIKANFAKESDERLPKKPKSDRLISDDYLSILLCASKPKFMSEFRHARLRAAIGLGAFAGMRRGEICGLRWRDIDFDGRKISVREAVRVGREVAAPKTKAGMRTVDMAPELAMLLRHLRDASPGQNFVMRRDDEDEPVRTTLLNEALTSACGRAGLAAKDGKPLYGMHALRHYAGGWLLKQGVPIPAISKFMGYASPLITMSVYAHVLPGDDSVSAAFSTSRMASAKVQP